ncbi:lonely Cys domain-containing protein, partial [Streptomyces sp. NPDC002523]
MARWIRETPDADGQLYVEGQPILLLWDNAGMGDVAEVAPEGADDAGEVLAWTPSMAERLVPELNTYVFAPWGRIHQGDYNAQFQPVIAVHRPGDVVLTGDEDWQPWKVFLPAGDGLVSSRPSPVPTTTSSTESTTARTPDLRPADLMPSTSQSQESAPAFTPPQGPPPLDPGSAGWLQSRNVRLHGNAAPLTTGFIPPPGPRSAHPRYNPWSSYAPLTEVDFTTIQANPDGTVAPQYRYDDSLLFIDLETYDPTLLNHIFANGLPAPSEGPLPDLETYLLDPDAMGYIATTRSDSIRDVPQGAGVRLLIDVPGGFDVQATFPETESTENENTVLHPDSIAPQFIVGAEIVNGAELDGETGRYTTPVTFVPNPQYWPTHRPAIVISALPAERVLDEQRRLQDAEPDVFTETWAEAGLIVENHFPDGPSATARRDWAQPWVAYALHTYRAHGADIAEQVAARLKDRLSLAPPVTAEQVATQAQMAARGTEPDPAERPHLLSPSETGSDDGITHPERDHFLQTAHRQAEIAEEVRRKVGPRVRRVLDRQDLERAVADVLAAHQGQSGVGTRDRDDSGPAARLSADDMSAQECLVLLHSLRNRLFPEGVAPAGRGVDDSVLDVRPQEGPLALGEGWKRVGSWGTVETAVAKTGPGSVAFVLARRLDRMGHAFAAYALPVGVTGENPAGDDGKAKTRVVWVDVQASRVSDVPPPIAPSEARAVIVDATARVAAHALPDHIESASPEHLLVDPARSHQLGKIGWEAELEYILVAEGLLPKKVVARHPGTGFEIVTDEREFFRGQDDKLYLNRDQAVEKAGGEPRSEVRLIAELVTSPLAVLEEDAGWVDGEVGFEQHMRTRRLLERTDREGHSFLLSELLTEEDGWEIEYEAPVEVLPSVSGAGHAAYTQFTVGVPAAGLAPLLELVRSHLDSPWLGLLIDAGRDFGDHLAAEYAQRLLERPVTPNEALFLTDLVGLDALRGYAWLAFNHVAALPLWKRSGYRVLAKNVLPAASRTPLDVLRGSLDEEVKDFLVDHEGTITTLFENHVRDLVEEFLRGAPDFVGDTQHILEERWKEGTISTRDYLETALIGSARSGAEVTQHALLGMEDYPDLDTNGGRITHPLALIELRDYSVDSVVPGPGQDRRYLTDAVLHGVFDEISELAVDVYEQATRTRPDPESAADVLQHSLVVQIADVFERTGNLTLSDAEGNRHHVLPALDKALLVTNVSAHAGRAEPLSPDVGHRLNALHMKLQQGLAALSSSPSSQVRSSFEQAESAVREALRTFAGIAYEQGQPAPGGLAGPSALPVPPGDAVASTEESDPTGEDEAVDLLEALWQREFRGPLDLDLVAGAVLHLRPGSTVDASHHSELLDLVDDILQAGQADELTSLRDLSLHHLAPLLGEDSVFHDAHGRPGRDWDLPDPATSRGELITGSVLVPDPGRIEYDVLMPAPWVRAGGIAYPVLLRREPSGPVLHHAGTDYYLGDQELAQLLALDPLLADRPDGVHVVLAGSGTGSGPLVAPRAVANAVRRPTWSYTSTLFRREVIQARDGVDVAHLHFGAHRDDRRNLPTGVWVRSDVDDRYLFPGTTGPSDMMISEPIVDSDGYTIGRASFLPDFWARAERDYQSLNSWRTYNVLNAARGEVVHSDVPLPWAEAGERPYFFSAHGRNQAVHIRHIGGDELPLDRVHFGQVLRRRPSLSARPSTDPVVLLACSAERLLPGEDPLTHLTVGGQLANDLGRRVYAANARVVVINQSRTSDGDLRGPFLNLDSSVPDPRWIERRPEPDQAQLQQLMGTHRIPDEETALRLVRLVRHVHGAGIEDQEALHSRALTLYATLDARRRTQPEFAGRPLTTAVMHEYAVFLLARDTSEAGRNHPVNAMLRVLAEGTRPTPVPPQADAGTAPAPAGLLPPGDTLSAPQETVRSQAGHTEALASRSVEASSEQLFALSDDHLRQTIDDLTPRMHGGDPGSLGEQAFVERAERLGAAFGTLNDTVAELEPTGSAVRRIHLQEAIAEQVEAL